MEFFFNLLRQSQHFRNFQEPAERAVHSKSKLFPGWSFCPTGDSPCGCDWEAAPCHTVLVNSDHRPQIWGLGKERKGHRGGRSGNPAAEGGSNLLWWWPQSDEAFGFIGIIHSY